VSDLQCPATFVLVPADAEAAVVLRALAHDRVAEVRAGDHPGAADLARALAASWGLPGPAPSDLDAASYRDVLTDLADLRRGETTVVVVEPALTVHVVGGGRGRGAGLVVVEVDADGVVVRGRGGAPDARGVRGSAAG